ncbi:MAG TPA: cyclic pyranopterin monophosphate synthase MoaC [Brevundimonas sp.]|uniref:cyclic pyranopterin monophosphate synthase MoaC n=1 Tax=Brevundimonas sp. TaxID=1871086 RepID=UPI0026305ABE|nr:cyclic pyranopterin monophosphate synthase MoaC [Brevundimonas sp.]HRO32111.1 cyclic pyranopterin monophosphate synthase MoaC [Brevundimonas sp.]
MSGLTHLDTEGRARMVDVSAKAPSARRAVARADLHCRPETLALVLEGRAPKGAVIQTAELAGVMAAKRTADLIPLCHPLPLSKAAVTITPDRDLPGFRIEAETVTVGVTGVEMEALTAASVAGLTLYDMLKAVDRAMRLDQVRLVLKSGGRSGEWRAPDEVWP